MKRQFSLADDDAIMRHIRGDFSIKALERMVHSSQRTLEKRAEELGVTLRIDKKTPRIKIHQRRYLNSNTEMKHEWGQHYVCTVGPDELLSRLQQHHPDRRYEDIKHGPPFRTR